MLLKQNIIEGKKNYVKVKEFSQSEKNIKKEIKNYIEIIKGKC